MFNNTKKYLSFLFISIILLTIISFIGCKGKPATVEEEKVLNIYNWEDYFGETTIEDFEKEFGIKVNLEYFEDEDIMFSAIQSNPDKYDLFIASDVLIIDFTNTNLVASLNLENIPNLKNIDERFLNLNFDPQNKYSVPYFWGTTGLLVNQDCVTEEVDSWSILWNEKYKGKIGMLNNGDEVIATALKYLGYSINTKNASELEEARQLLLKQKNNVLGYFDFVTNEGNLKSQKICIAQHYSGDAMQFIDQNPDLNLTYIIPKEGVAIWIDNFAIPKEAKHKKNAELFINYVLRPKVSADIANYMWYANTNQAAAEFTDPEILEDPSVYPPEEVIQKAEFFEDLGETANIHNKIWAELQR